MTPTTEAALLVVVNNMDGEKWHTSTKHVQRTMKLSNFSRTPECLDLFARDPSPWSQQVAGSQLKLEDQMWLSDGDWTAALEHSPHPIMYCSVLVL